jgi:hypothetical protein
MGARYLKVEEAVIRKYYPTAARWKIMGMMPDRTWAEIGVKARKMGIHRTSAAKGDSIREGRKLNPNAWSDEDNDKFNRYYPHSTRSALLEFFKPKTWLAIQSHAQKRHLHRTREAVGREINIGRENARKEKNNL